MKRSHLVATLIAALLAVPFILIGANSWNCGGMYEDVIGDLVFGMLGAPLTSTTLNYYVHHVGFLTRQDNVWAVPLWGALLICQWIVWANLLVLIVRLCIRFFLPGISEEFRTKFQRRGKDT